MEDPFVVELQELINKYSQEGLSGTPDFVLARYLKDCLDAYNRALMTRSNWRGESLELP